MEKGLSFYWKLFLSTFTISAFTVGGGYVIVPLMRKKFVEKLHWIEDTEMLDLVAIAQAAPGVMAVNASILVGYKISGIKGAFVTILGTVLPPLITITLIAYGYEAFSANKVIRMLLMGMQAGAAAVIANVVINMTRDILRKKHWKPIGMMVLAFIATAFFGTTLHEIVWQNADITAIILFAVSLAAMRIFKKADPMLVIFGAGVLGLGLYSLTGVL